MKYTNIPTAHMVFSFTVEILLWLMLLKTTEVNSEGGAAVCIYGDETATLSTGVQKPVKELEIGDKVHAVNAAGEIITSSVFLQFHDRNSLESDVVTLRLLSGKKLTLTLEHLVFVSKRCITPIFTKAVIIYAQHVKEGDCLFVLRSDHEKPLSSPEPHQIKVDKVTNVERETVIGVYGPVTYEGTLLVNDIVVSCYAYLEDHHYAHNIFSIFHYLPEQGAYGIQSMFQNMSTFQLAKWLWSIKDKVTSIDNGICFQRLQ